MFGNNSPVGVLIHGCHLQADLEGRTWQNLIWGSDNPDTPSMSGRVVMGIYVALHRQARLVTFSTGASEIDGIKEAAYTRNFVNKHIDALAKLLSQKLNHAFTGKDLHAWLDHRSVLDLESQNTVEETESNLSLALARKCKEVIGVTNAFHAPRCLAGLQAARINHDSPLLISVIPAFDDGSATVIIEVPHRGDQVKTIRHLLAKELFKVPADKVDEFAGRYRELIETFQNQQTPIGAVVHFEGKDYVFKQARNISLVNNSLEPLRVTRENNASRHGIRVRLVDPDDGMPRRIHLWDSGEEWGPIEPGSPAYGADGADTGW